MTSLTTTLLKAAYSKISKTLPQSFVAYDGDNVKEVLNDIRLSIKEIVIAVEELQQLRFRAREVETDGMPVHGSVCEVLQGQFLRLTQPDDAGVIVRVEHGLRRTPQGVIWLNLQSGNQAYIVDEIGTDIPAATADEISVKLNSSIGQLHIMVIF